MKLNLTQMKTPERAVTHSNVEASYFVALAIYDYFMLQLKSAFNIEHSPSTEADYKKLMHVLTSPKNHFLHLPALAKLITQFHKKHPLTKKQAYMSTNLQAAFFALENKFKP